MTEGARAAAVIGAIACAWLGCVPTDAKPRAPAGPCATEGQMSGEEHKLWETAVATLSGYSVGTGTIWEQALPDDTGAVARRMAAHLSILNDATHEERGEDVFAGHVMTLGADRYQIVCLEPARNEGYGWIIVRKLLPERHEG